MTEIKADSDGTAIPVTVGWQDRAKRLLKPEYFEVEIRVSPAIFDDLSGAEMARLKKKLKLVDRWAKNMSLGMLKGTLKFPNDTWEMKDWMASMLGEGADFSNYLVLMCDKYEQTSDELIEALRHGG